MARTMAIVTAFGLLASTALTSALASQAVHIDKPGKLPAMNAQHFALTPIQMPKENPLTKEKAGAKSKKAKGKIKKK